MTKTQLLREFSAALDSFRAGELPEGELYDIVHQVGHEPSLMREAKPLVESLLTVPEDQLRYIALHVLTLNWRCLDHRSTCERFIMEDPDGDNRRMGVFGLGALLRGTRDPAALALLLGLFHDEDQERQVRQSAYFAILHVLGRHPSEFPSAARWLDFGQDIRWDWIREAEELAKRAQGKASD